jgi:hypothetical protein
MKYLKLFLFLMIFLTSCLAKAQTELELKTTGKYLFSWSFENSEAIAKESAKLGLLDTIFVSLLKESAIDKTDTVFINVIHYFVKKVGFKWQAIAFAEKSDVKIKLEQRKQLKVIPVIIGARADDAVKYNIKPDRKEKVQDLNTAFSVGSTNIAKNENQVLDELLVLHDAKSLEQQLRKYKSDLKLNFGDKSNYPNDTECYIFVIDEKTLQVIAVYDKGKESRRNFLTNTTDSNYGEKFKGNHFVYVAIK